MNQIIFTPTKKYSLWSAIPLWIFCGMGVFFALILLWQATVDWPSDSSYKNLILGGPLLLFFIWFRWQFIGHSTVMLNAEAVWQKQPVISPRIEWNNIAGVQFRESTLIVKGVRAHRRLAEIKTKNNKRVNFVLSTLSSSDREQVERWLEQAAQTGEVPGELLVILKKTHA